MVPVRHYDTRYVEVFTIMKILTFKHEPHFCCCWGQNWVGGGAYF